METIRVVIADDHPLVRCGIRETLRGAENIVLVGEASRGDETQELCRELQPDVLLLDLQMPGATAVETVTYIRAHCPQARVIILTAYDDAVYVHRMLVEGVVGYVLKDEATEVVIIAIRSVVQGGMWLSRRVLDMLATGKPASASSGEAPKLSELEQQLLRCLMDGMRDKEIAQVVHLPVGTVRNELSKLYATLSVEGRLQAAKWGWTYGCETDRAGQGI